MTKKERQRAYRRWLDKQWPALELAFRFDALFDAGEWSLGAIWEAHEERAVAVRHQLWLTEDETYEIDNCLV
jgi:hypothetical protein